MALFIGPDLSGRPLEVGVVVDDDGTAIIHAMRARQKFLKRVVDTMTSRKDRAAALERWADTVQTTDLREMDTCALRDIAERLPR